MFSRHWDTCECFMRKIIFLFKAIILADTCVHRHRLYIVCARSHTHTHTHTHNIHGVYTNRRPTGVYVYTIDRHTHGPSYTHTHKHHKHIWIANITFHICVSWKCFTTCFCAFYSIKPNMHEHIVDMLFFHHLRGRIADLSHSVQAETHPDVSCKVYTNLISHNSLFM